MYLEEYIQEDNHPAIPPTSHYLDLDVWLICFTNYFNSLMEDFMLIFLRISV